MATRPRIRQGMTLEEFLRWPRIDEQPYLEFINGRIEVKVSPQRKHSAVEKNLTIALDQFAKPSGLGEAYPNLRCTFAGLSMVPDIVFQRHANIPRDEHGDVSNESLLPPDILIEIRSPGEPIDQAHAKIVGSIADGCPLAWFIDPCEGTADVFRAGVAPERLPADGFLDGSPVLPGFRLAVAEIFDWSIDREPGSDESGAGDQ